MRSHFIKLRMLHDEVAMAADCDSREDATCRDRGERALDAVEDYVTAQVH